MAREHTVTDLRLEPEPAWTAEKTHGVDICNQIFGDRGAELAAAFQLLGVGSALGGLTPALTAESAVIFEGSAMKCFLSHLG